MSNGHNSTNDANPTFLVADLFCGAGGTSTGATNAVEEIGGEIDLVAVNHWPVAVETHKLNHPEARHYVQDLDGADPEMLIPEGRLDLLMASPECRHFSRARGGKPMKDQSRMNPWIVHRWLTALNVRCLLVENVPEFTSWGPLNDDWRPDPEKKGVYFEEWVRSLWGLGYDVQWRMLNAADYGEATTRVRFFLQARKDGLPIQWPEPTHAKAVEGSLMEELPRWRGAREIIDWSNPGRSLLDDPKYKKRPLSEKTRRRIARGLQRFGGPLAPLYIRLLDLPDEDTYVDAELDDVPEAVAFHGSNRQNTMPRGVDEPIPTATTWGNGGCYMVKAEAEPFMLGQQSGGAPRLTDEPIPTVTADGAISLLRPIVTEYYSNGHSRSVEKPLSSVTTKARHGLTTPVVVRMSQTGGNGSYVREVGEPLPTITTKNDMCIVTPEALAYVIPNFGERDGQGPRGPRHRGADPNGNEQGRGKPRLAHAGRATQGEGQGRSPQTRLRERPPVHARHPLPDAAEPGAGPRDGVLRRGEHLRVRRQCHRNHKTDRQRRARAGGGRAGQGGAGTGQQGRVRSCGLRDIRLEQLPTGPSPPGAALFICRNPRVRSGMASRR